jgi:hypothetical protein
MRSEIGSNLALAILGVLLGVSATAAAVQVDQFVGATSSGGAYFVKRFSVPAGSVIVGAELVTNDLRTSFPRVKLLLGNGRRLGSLTQRAELVDVQATTRHVVQATFSAVQVDQPQNVYVAVGLPSNTGVRSVGDGPGLGALELRGPGNSYLASGLDGRLQPIDLDLCIRLLFQGAAKQEATEEVPEPVRFAMEARPNPFNPTTTIEFGVPSQSRVELSIYTVAGHLVRSLAKEDLSANVYRRVWDGRDEQGNAVAGGVYVARLCVGEKVLTQRLVIVK